MPLKHVSRLSVESVGKKAPRSVLEPALLRAVWRCTQVFLFHLQPTERREAHHEAPVQTRSGHA